MKAAKILSKTVQSSQVEMREIVMPHQANPQNTIFGGVVMSWIDMAAAMVASKHAGMNVVTAHIESIDFKAPIKVGNHVLIKAKLHATGKTSMEIGVEVFSENPFTGLVRETTSAFLTFVALDEFGRPAQVPALEISTPEEKELFQKANQRISHRKGIPA